jgi:putative tricarboxylic transport membrane protein
MASRRADLILGVIVAALGAYALFLAMNLTLFSKEHVPGPGLFPTLIASGMLVLGVLLATLSTRDLVRWRHRVPADEPVADPLAEIVESGPSQPRRVLRAGSVFACYAVTMPLMTILGFVPAAAVLVFLVLFGVEGRRNWRALAAAVLIPVAAFFLFVHLLTIQLPTGLIELGPLSS